jgi:hypothetical protein
VAEPFGAVFISVKSYDTEWAMALGLQYLNGYVSEQGRRASVPTPFNDKVVELITRVPPGTLKPDPRNLEPLVAMLPK